MSKKRQSDRRSLMGFQWFAERLYDVNLFSIVLRMALAVVFGGIIGLERGANKHQAGLRTHILVCVGATLAMLTNQYIIEQFDVTADPARLGAQVISGIGFLGAGLILVTSKNKVKGLTTAAGLWASACVGLALGIGFYSGAIVTGALVFIVLALLPGVENYFYNRSRIMDLVIDLDSMANLRAFIGLLRQREIIIQETHITQSNAILSDGYTLHISIRIPKKCTHGQIIEELSSDDGVIFIEELE